MTTQTLERYTARNMLPLLFYMPFEKAWPVAQPTEQYGEYQDAVDTLLAVHRNANEALATGEQVDPWASAQAVWEGYRANKEVGKLDGEVRKLAEAMDLVVEPPINVSEDAKRRAAQEEPKKYRVQLMHGSEIKKNIAPLQWLIPGFLPKNKLVQNYGMGGSGKSTINLDIALTLSQFINVVYCAGEDESEYVGRTEAWTQFHKRDFGGFYFYPAPFNLMKPEEVQDFLEQIKPHEPQLIILDPLINFMVGYSDSDQKDMTLVIESLNHIRRETNGATMYVCHHTGWSETHERGSSALRAACRMVAKTTNNDGRVVFTCEKANGFKKFDPRYFDAEFIGNDIVLVPSTRGADNGKVSQLQIKVLESLQLEQYRDDGATFMQILEEVEVKKSSLNAAISKLLKLNAIYKDSDKRRGAQYICTELGKKVLNRADEGHNPAYGQLRPDGATGMNWSIDESSVSDAHSLITSYRSVDGYELETELPAELDSELGTELHTELTSELTQGVNYGGTNFLEDDENGLFPDPSSIVVQSSRSLVHDSSELVHDSSELPSSSSFGSVSLGYGLTELQNEPDIELLRDAFTRMDLATIYRHCSECGLDKDVILDMLAGESGVNHIDTEGGL